MLPLKLARRIRVMLRAKIRPKAKLIRVVATSFDYSRIFNYFTMDIRSIYYC